MADIIPGVGHLLIGQPEISERLQRGLNLKGELPQFTESEYGLSITSEDLTEFQFRHLRRQGTFVSVVSVAAVAAQFSFVLFGPPQASAPRRDALARTDKLYITNPAAAAVSVDVGLSTQQGFAIVAGGGAGVTDDREGVVGGSRSPFCGFFLGNSAVPPAINGPFRVQVPGNSTKDIDTPFVLSGKDLSGLGQGPAVLQVVAGVVNVPLTLSVVWSERPLMTSEL